LVSSSLAQPSGLYYADGLLYFADSESSSVRVADFEADEVRTLAGPTRDSLFEFGDVDGQVGASRLQHPLDVTGGPDGLLYVADTYNSKIKVIDPGAAEIRTLLGLGGSGGFADGGPDVAAFDEPGGLDYAGGRLYIADTNNHAVRVIDLSSGAASTMQFPNPEALRTGDSVLVVGGDLFGPADIVLPEQTVSAGGGQIILEITLPEGFKVNDLAESFVSFASEDETVQIAGSSRVVIEDNTRRASLPVVYEEGRASLRADLTLYYCRTGEEELCFIELVVLEVPIRITAGGEPALRITYEVVPPVDA
jgi:DNA-binding beta-propeller fold protein YncE